jgi:hypothetical protein
MCAAGGDGGARRRERGRQARRRRPAQGRLMTLWRQGGRRSPKLSGTLLLHAVVLEANWRMQGSEMESVAWAWSASTSSAQRSPGTTFLWRPHHGDIVGP